MTINEYETIGGFREELASVRTIGIEITRLREWLESRPHRQPERDALKSLTAALEKVREEILNTRNTQ